MPQTGDCVPRHSAAVCRKSEEEVPLSEAWSAAREDTHVQVPYLGTARLACITCHRMRETTPVSACARRRAAAQAYSLGKSREPVRAAIADVHRAVRACQRTVRPDDSAGSPWKGGGDRGKGHHKEDLRVDETVVPFFTRSLRDPWGLARFCLCVVLFAVLPRLLTHSVEREMVDRGGGGAGAPDFDFR